jgi:hypothetical protein
MEAPQSKPLQQVHLQDSSREYVAVGLGVELVVVGDGVDVEVGVGVGVGVEDDEAT